MSESKRRSPDGLAGEWVSLDDLAGLDFFSGKKRAFKVKLNTNFSPRPGETEPGIKAAVRRPYAAGETICRAGDYGSTAFLLVSGRARSFVPEQAAVSGVRGRTAKSLDWMKDLFKRRTSRADAAPDRLEVGEISRYAAAECPTRSGETALGPGDFFGIDTCVNFYPREATVEAVEDCVVIEMLRSVLDSVRDAGTVGPDVQAAYEEAAIANELRLASLTADLSVADRDILRAGATLLTPDSADVKNGVLYQEGEPADALYLVRSGSIKLARQSAGNEFVFSYLGRGASFGFEKLLPSRRRTELLLRCISHPELIAEVPLEGTLTIGRSPSCEVAVPRDDVSVSRRHCQIEARDGAFFLLDLGSANFTKLNGDQVQRARLVAGDRIAIVDYAFEVVRPEADRTRLGDVVARFATATGLDNFEVVRLQAKDLREIADKNAAFGEQLVRIGRSLESAIRLPASELERIGGLVDANLFNSQNTLLIDLDRCTRCDECVRACSDAHDGVARFTRDGPRYGNYLLTMACRSCTDPKCMIGCPVGSIRREGSLEIQIEDWCIGCERCANQCPFGNIHMAERPSAGATSQTDEAPAETPLQATVCDLCRGYDVPNCVYACPHDAAIRVNPTEFLAGPDRGRSD